jgi:hypothetical protein
MKVCKWNKIYVDPVKLLKKVGAVHENQAYPSYVFVSPKRYKEMKKEIIRVVKEEIGKSSTRRINYYVGLHMLNFGPVEVKGLPDNIVLVDDLSIKREVELKQEKQKHGS